MCQQFYCGTSPHKFFDYSAAGLPVVCNYPGWLAEMIQSHGCGLADALCALADDRETAKTVGARARHLASQQFDRRQLAGHSVAVIENLT
jgi:hypothetical protein